MIIKADQMGRLLLPKQMRDYLNISKDTLVKIELTDDKKVILTVIKEETKRSDE